MQTRVLAGIFAFMFAAGGLQSGFAQQRPDFGGSWIVDRVEMPEMPSGGPGGGPGGGRMPGGGGMPGGGRGGRGGGMRGGGPGGGRGDMPGRGADMLREGNRVTIAQTPEGLTVSTEDGRATTYRFDGEAAASADQQGGKVLSRTRWEGVALVTESERSMTTPRGEMKIKTREVRSLDEEGKTMTVKITNDTPRGAITRTVILVKEDGPTRE